MAVLCIILNDADRAQVESTDNDNKGYLNGSELHPVPRQGGTNGNPDPCFILNSAVLTNEDFTTAQPYLSGLSQKWSDAADFPPPLPPQE